MAKRNEIKGAQEKAKARAMVDKAVGVDDKNSDPHGEKEFKGLMDNEMQAGFPARKSKVNMSGSKDVLPDQDEEGATGKGGLYAEDHEEDGQRSKLKQKGGAMKRASLMLSKKYKV